MKDLILYDYDNMFLASSDQRKLTIQKSEEHFQKINIWFNTNKSLLNDKKA